MLVAPGPWYAAVPGVTHTGPFNQHFVRDIGCAYLVSGGALIWLARDVRAWPAAMLAGLFLGLHAGTHVWDALAGREELTQLIVDLPDVFLPPVLVLWLSWRARTPSAVVSREA